jgi:tryptophan synthase alpha chain
VSRAESPSSERKRLVIYLMAGEDMPELARAAHAGGADIVEIGFPFSDPLADGPVIRRAADRALRDGMRVGRCLEVLARTRALLPGTPLVPMTYASLFEAYGWERLATDLRAAGATSMIIADLPADVRREIRRVQLVAPTTSDERVRLAASITEGWLYLVTVTGVTGMRNTLPEALPELATRVRRISSVPVYAGFGIATPDQASAVGALVDGVVIGSRAVEVASSGTVALREYVTSVRAALDGSPATFERAAIGSSEPGGSGAL